MLDRELVEAVKLAREAGEILMRIYATDFDVEYKGEADPVTEADRLANDLLVRRLREAFPNDGVVAEETPDKSDALRRGRCWYVDPLDGTKEFIAKNGEFSVMIGLAVDGEARLGVVYRPVGDRLYRGVVGDSAFIDVGDRTFALGVTDTSEPSELRLVVSRSHRSQEIDDLVEKLGISDERKSGSVGLKVGLIAERDADLYVHLSEHSSAWDSCAPEAILKAAGGCFVDLSGRAFDYGGADMANRRGILAVNRHETLQAVLPVVEAIARAKGLLVESNEPDSDTPTLERPLDASSEPPPSPSEDADEDEEEGASAEEEASEGGEGSDDSEGDDSEGDDSEDAEGDDSEDAEGDDSEDAEGDDHQASEGDDSEEDEEDSDDSEEDEEDSDDSEEDEEDSDDSEDEDSDEEE